MNASTRSDDLLELARRYGVATSYYDWRGTPVEVPTETLVAVLAALDVDAATDEAVRAALRFADERPWRRGVPATTVTTVGQDATVPVHVPHGAGVVVEVALETGDRIRLDQVDRPVAPRHIDDVLVGEATFRVPADLPLGWHTLTATLDGAIPTHSATLLGFAAPARSRRAARAAEPSADSVFAANSEAAATETITTPVATGTLISTPQRPATDIDSPGWGLMTQLYQARSAGSWGVGDLGDLHRMGEWAAARDADFVLINPVHAPAPVTPITPSPYLPTTRTFIDPAIIRIADAIADIEASQDAAAAAGQTRNDAASAAADPLEPEVRQRIRELAAYASAENSADMIDRDRAWLAKREALWLVFTAAMRVDGPYWNRFGEFCEVEGDGLMNFATWCALTEQLGSDWRTWPAALQRPDSAEVAAFRQQQSVRVQFYSWMQFVAREQSVAVQHGLRDAGMRIGVMRDLAVGVSGAGADAWALGDALARGVTVGAPPDAFNQLGQNWGQPPLRPDSLERQGYAPMRDLLRNAFAGAGALRIDHILGLFRLWWVPAGAPASAGTYVAYDYDAMLGVLLLEADRAGALVVGEDLGVVSDLTREQMAARHVYGTQIMWFEHAPDGGPKAPSDYRRECLATVTTHDLPPTAGYLELAHIDVRDRLGLFTRPVDEERADEQAWVDAHLATLRGEGRITTESSTEDIVVALYERLASSASKLLGVAVADLVGDRRSINQPGTDREYDNWTLPLADAAGNVMSLEDVLASPLAARLAEAATRTTHSVAIA